MDRVFIRKLEAYCILGVNAWEREALQKVQLDIVMECPCRPAGQSDQMALAVDYRAVAKEVLQLVEGSQFYLVEALAEAVAAKILETQPKVVAVTVTVAKPGAVRFSQEVGVTIRRQREQSP